MSMLPFRNGRKEPTMNVAPQKTPSLKNVSAETAQYFERAAQIEAERDELLDTVSHLKRTSDDNDARWKVAYAEVKREIDFLREQLNAAANERDFYLGQYRALDAATEHAAEMILRQRRNAQREAIENGIRTDEQQRGHESSQGVGDVERDIKNIAQKFGANNREDQHETVSPPTNNP